MAVEIAQAEVRGDRGVEIRDDLAGPGTRLPSRARRSNPASRFQCERLRHLRPSLSTRSPARAHHAKPAPGPTRGLEHASSRSPSSIALRAGPVHRETHRARADLLPVEPADLRPQRHRATGDPRGSEKRRAAAGMAAPPAPISAAATRYGRWLVSATARSWSSGPSRSGPRRPARQIGQPVDAAARGPRGGRNEIGGPGEQPGSAAAMPWPSLPAIGGLQRTSPGSRV